MKHPRLYYDNGGSPKDYRGFRIVYTQDDGSIRHVAIEVPYENTEEAHKAVDIVNKELDRVQLLAKALLDLRNDCLSTDFNEHWDSYKQAELALTEVGIKE